MQIKNFVQIEKKIVIENVWKRTYKKWAHIFLLKL
jgi:hypothetical protein